MTADEHEKSDARLDKWGISQADLSRRNEGDTSP